MKGERDELWGLRNGEGESREKSGEDEETVELHFGELYTCV